MAMIATGITAMNFPITPSTKKNGMNAMIVVLTAVITDGMTSTVPSIDAVMKSLPINRCE